MPRPSGPRPGDQLELVVEKAVYRGLGLARHEGQIVLVERGLPGDRWRVRVSSAARGLLRAEPMALLDPGPGRRAAPCEHAHACGGCTYQELGPTEQIALKRAVLLETLTRAGVDCPDVSVTAGPEQGWRMRAQLHVSADGRCGLYARGSHSIVPIDTCLQLSTGLNRCLRSLEEELRRRPELLYAPLRVELCESLAADVRVAAISLPAEVLAGSGLPEALLDNGDLHGVGALEGETRRRRYVALAGRHWLTADVLGLELGFSPLSFFQSNRHLVEPLARYVVELVPPDRAVLDLYAGVGLFGLPLARRGQRVDAVESSATAVQDAQRNARALPAGAPFRMHPADTLDWLRGQRTLGGATAVVDPPRAGLGAAVVEALVALRPGTIVYVSCDPSTLARDLAWLSRAGWRADAWRAFDLFPDTFHIETVVRLRPS